MATASRLTLAEAVRQVRETGRQTTIRCPIHDDRQASLSVWKTHDGWVHFKCQANQAGCTESALEASAGLSIADRAPPGEGPGFPRATRNGNDRNLDIVYDYTDEAGKILFQVVRRPDKQFRQRKPDPANPGAYLWSLNGTRRVLYRLPQIMDALQSGTPIWIVEGEKDVASCEARGLVATTNPGGAGKWLPEYSRLLGGASVTIVADKDDPGIAHAKSVAASLRGAQVRDWRIVTAAAGKDATDHFDAGHTVEHFVEIHRSPTAKRRPGEPIPAEPDPSETPARRLTEGGNADRFVAMFADDVRYVEEAATWFVWDGQRFQRDSVREVNGLAREVVGELYAAASTEKDQTHRRNLAEHAKRSDSAHAVRALLDLAKADRAIARRLDDFDRQTDLLTVANGTLDLTSGQLQPPTRDHQSTRLAPVAYVPQAACPRWEDFLWTVFKERPHLVRYVQKAIGYSLTGDQTEQCLFLLFGSGANGKSTFLETVRQMLGDYGHTAKTETVLLSKDERSHTPRPDLLDLRGRRMVTASEVVEGKHFNEALVKSMTGGEELNARALYGSTAITFTPTHKLWLGVNHLPVIRGDDEGIWRRIRVIPFDVTIPEGQRDPGLPAALRAEWPGILAWAVQGCLLWRQERLGTPPAEVSQATTSYREESDVLGDFLTECCDLGADQRTNGGLLYATYKAWAIDSGVRPMTKQAFPAKLLTRKEIQRDRKAGGTVYFGLSVKPQHRPKDTAGSPLFGGE